VTTTLLAVEEQHKVPETHRSQPGRLGPWWLNALRAVVGLPWQRRLARAALLVPRIRYHEQQAAKLSDAQLRQTSLRLRGRARAGESLDRLLPEAFGLASVAAHRVLNMRPYDVQLAAGVVLHQSALAELATGEGKTLTAMLPTYLNALLGRGAHVATVNDYLAKRDAEWLGPVYELLGLSVGVLQQQMQDSERYAAYQCDVTYGTASEFGFDFLRDRLKIRGQKQGQTPFWDAWLNRADHLTSSVGCVQRELFFALVDEADSIFIDEARTPLIIATPTRPATPEEQVVYHWANALAQTLRRDEHFKIDLKKSKVELTEGGKRLMRWSNPPTGEHSHAMDKLQEHLERAVQAHHRFIRDQHYMVSKDGKIVIIDESTGRPMPDRHWREGLHQAVEAKEGVEITKPSEHAAQITYQNFYRLYRKLAGMTGTAAQNFWEIRRVYKLWVVCVPTNRPVIRKHYPDQIYPTEDAKFRAVVERIQREHARGRPVLVGTRSVEKSEKLSRLLTAAGIPHQVLNARQNADEARIVAQAGQPGAVTVATNMAGRGTDIKLGPGVAELGGLHVIGTERHESRRIDRQLLGRAGRQGDPGSGLFMLSLEDELLEALGPAMQEKLRRIGQAGGQRDWNEFRPFFRLAQLRAERRNTRQRLDMMHYDRQRRETLAFLGADPFVD
jgi:preprotein translocase subunit SecA